MFRLYKTHLIAPNLLIVQAAIKEKQSVKEAKNK